MNGKMLTYAITMATIAIFVSTIFADIVIQKDGTKIEGKLIEKISEHLKLETFDGIVTINVKEISKHNKTESLYEKYLKEKKSLKEDDAEGCVKIGLWCKNQKLLELAKEH